MFRKRPAISAISPSDAMVHDRHQFAVEIRAEVGGGPLASTARETAGSPRCPAWGTIEACSSSHIPRGSRASTS